MSTNNTNTDIFALADDVATKWRELSDALARLGTHANAYVEQIAPVMADVVQSVATNVTEAAEVARILSADATESTDGAEHGAPGESSTQSSLEAAEAWLLRDHDTSVSTGMVAPATDRAHDLVELLQPVMYGEAADYLRSSLLCTRPGDPDLRHGVELAARWLDAVADGRICGHTDPTGECCADEVDTATE